MNVRLTLGVVLGLMFIGASQVQACQKEGDSKVQDRDLLTWPLSVTHQSMQVYVGDVMLITLPHLDSLYWLDQDVPVDVLRPLRDDALQATLTLMDMDSSHRNDAAYSVLAPGHARIHFQAFVLPGKVWPGDVPNQLVLDLDAHVRTVVKVTTVTPTGVAPPTKVSTGFWSRWLGGVKTKIPSQPQRQDTPCQP